MGVVWMHFESGKDRQTDGVSSKKRGVCRHSPTYALGIRGLDQFGTDLTNMVDLDDTGTSVVIRDLEEFLVVR